MKKIILFSIISLFFLSHAIISHAQATSTSTLLKAADKVSSTVGGIVNPGDKGTYTLLEPLPCVPTRDKPCTPGDTIKTFTVNQFIEYMFKFAIALAVLLATIQVIIGGFLYMGDDSYSKKSEGKKKFKDAAIGLVGALVSFLVLQTIDPRFAQIHATIDPICGAQPSGNVNSICNKSAVDDFNKELYNNLHTVATDKAVAANALEQQKTQLLQQKNDLMDRYQEITDEKDPDYIRQEDYEKQMAQLDQNLSNVTAQQSGIVASGLGTVAYQQSHEEIFSTTGAVLESKYTAAQVPNTLVNGKLPVNTANGIQDQYNKYINTLLEVTPQTESSKTQVDALSKQRDFYVAQVQEEITLRGKINGEVRQYSVQTTYDRPYLTSKLAEYQANIDDPKKAQAAGLPVSEYVSIMRTRVDLIQQSLNK